MIKVGHKGKARYWGPYEVLKVAQLRKPIALHSKELGDVLFKPALIKIKWGDGSKEYWCCPYWIGPTGKERFALGLHCGSGPCRPSGPNFLAGGRATSDKLRGGVKYEKQDSGSTCP